MIRTNPELLGQQPPASVESEAALLGACLLDQTQLDEVAALVVGRDFYDVANGKLFDAILAIHEAGKPVSDMAVLVPELKSLGVFEQVGGAAALAKMFSSSTPNHARYYAGEVRKSSQLRRILDTSTEAIRRVHDPDAEPDAIVRFMETKNASLATGDISAAQTVGEISGAVLDDLERADADKRGAMTGLVNIDNTVGCIMPGEVMVIAARPGNGKTSMGVQIAKHNAEHGRHCLFISLEMNKAELVQRLMCSVSGVDSTALRTRTTSRDERQRLIEAAATLRGLPFTIHDPSSAAVEEIRGAARLEHKTRGVDLLVVDYLQRIRGSDTRLRKHEQLAEITNRLKDLAREINAPLIELCQINRESDKCPEPRLSHLAESSTIENDADIVMFLHRTNSGTQAIIAKHRHGDTGRIDLRFNGVRTRFEDNGSPNLKPPS